jgi:uncharacterized protein
LPRNRKRRRARVAVDTSVLVAGISGFREPFFPGRNPSADILQKWSNRNHFIWLITEEILDEYKEVLRRCGVRRNTIGRIINMIRERAEEIAVRSSVEISPDPEDDAFCFCAECGKADFIVTLNPKNFPQDRLKAIVLRPSEF